MALVDLQVLYPSCFCFTVCGNCDMVNSIRPQSFEAAKTSCDDLGGELWFPSQDVRYSSSHGPESSWINLKMVQSSWHWFEGKLQQCSFPGNGWTFDSQYKKPTFLQCTIRQIGITAKRTCQKANKS